MSEEFHSTWIRHPRNLFTIEENIDEKQANSHVDRLSLLCSFCKTHLSSLAVYREHLLLCGNKTDQCPKCRKFIRRATFAYHYENNCAIVHELDDSVSTMSTGFDLLPSISNVDDSLTFSSRSNKDDVKHKQHRATLISNEDNNDTSHMVPCTLCGQNYDETAWKKHQENCLQNSSTSTTSNAEQREYMNNTSRNKSFSTRCYQSNFRESVPCQYCNDNELFDTEQLSDHLKMYHQDNHQPILQRHIRRQLITSAVPCEYCEVLCPFDDINLHQRLLTSYEDYPNLLITEQHFSESAYLVRGYGNETPLWHYILVPASKVADLNAYQMNSKIDIKAFGSVIKYLSHRFEIKTMSGVGLYPPKIFQTWIAEHYSVAAVDQNIDLMHKNDDIRLCTMQRAVPEQLLGVRFCYFIQQQFHYIKLNENLPSSLAHRAGLKSYDRIIFFNDVNIENENFKQFLHRFKTARHLPVQMLVCSPTTYSHYKAVGKDFHCELPTVQRLKPVYATSTSNSNTDRPEIVFNSRCFYAVKWKNSDIVSAIPQSAILKSPEYTKVDDVCFIETKGRYREGQILLKGSRSDCKKLCTHQGLSGIDDIFSTLSNFFIRKLRDTFNSTRNTSPAFVEDKSLFSSDKLTTDTMPDKITIQRPSDHIKMVQNTNALQCIQHGKCTTLEELPNELLVHAFSFIDIHNLFNGLWGLNSRLNSIMQSYPNLSLTFNKNINPSLMKLYAPCINRLVIQTSTAFDLSQFNNLHKLILCDRNCDHLAQIQPKIIPNLTHLSFLLGPEFVAPSQLISDVFSNQFPSLRHVNLGCIDESTCDLWTVSPSLQFVSILSCKSNFVPIILTSCPNLQHLQIHILHNNNNMVASSTSLRNHPLRRFTIWSDYFELVLNDIDNLLVYTPNIEYLYLQAVYPMPFIDLANRLANRLNYLSQFDCYIKEMLTRDNRNSNCMNVHRIHHCFNRIKCIEENDEFRIFST
ncbi:unnamed protein product [Rotaria socialis]|uniref:F-box domain-containing protein n=1 Tax=Rotaria socialis TaxID=392032 RepID=A0A817VZG6_9BILA|nr:unnamed protein product [Rotaria socialis]